MLAEAINDYALEHDWIFFVRYDHFHKLYLGKWLTKDVYLALKGTTLRVVDARNTPYIQRFFDLSQPTCFDQIENWLLVKRVGPIFCPQKAERLNEQWNLQ